METNPSKLMPAVWGGVLIGVMSGVPFLSFINCACCAGVMGGGVLAVYLYRRDLDPTLPVQSSDGAVLGLLAGVFGAIVGSVIGAAFGVAYLDFMDRFSEYIDDPEVLDQMEVFQEYASTKMFILISFFTSLLIDCIFGLIGGLIGVSLFGKAKGTPVPE
jgi:hypothetical protein